MSEIGWKVSLAIFYIVFVDFPSKLPTDLSWNHQICTKRAAWDTPDTGPVLAHYGMVTITGLTHAKLLSLTSPCCSGWPAPGLEEYPAHDWRATTSVQRAPVTWRERGLWLQWWFPLQAVELKQWYAREFKDAMMADEPPAWFASFVSCELVMQFPFFFVATYAFYKGSYETWKRKIESCRPIHKEMRDKLLTWSHWALPPRVATCQQLFIELPWETFHFSV